MYDILKLVKAEKREETMDYNWYAIDPAIVYPATVKRIEEVLIHNEIPEELVDRTAPIEIDPRGVARMYISDARQVSAEAWGWALEPRESFEDEEEIKARALALEIARRWFTEALHVAIGKKPLGVHILKDERYKL